MLQVKLGDSWSTPVMIILLVMERSWIKGRSFTRAGSMGQGTKGDMSCLGPGVEFSLWKALCQSSVLLWQPCTAWEKGVAVVCPVLLAAAVMPHFLLSWQRTGQASPQWGPAAQESPREVAMLTTVSDVLIFCGQGQQLVQWAQSLHLCLGNVAGAGGKEGVELPFILLGKCFLAIHDRIPTWTVMPWLLKHQTEVWPPEFWVGSETAGRCWFVVLLMVDVPNGVVEHFLL